MTDYLLLRLYGPLASWGEIAVGESRHSAVHPSRSALLGLLGAALGIERHDDAGQQALADGYRFGIKLECLGSPLRDYHTVQVGVPPRKFQFRSRRQELAADKINTILSTREYRCDSLAVVAVEAMPTAPANLPALAQALRKPHFALYLVASHAKSNRPPGTAPGLCPILLGRRHDRRYGSQLPDSTP